jgi:hypothetical protein
MGRKAAIGLIAWCVVLLLSLAAPSAAVADALQHRSRPSVDVQWGKHGTMPLFWRGLEIIGDSGDVEAAYYPVGRPITLEVYNRGIFQKLSTEGRRAQDSPLGKNWPRKFTGAWEEFTDFSRTVDPVPFLQQKEMIEVTCFAMAAINRHFLPYNVRAKVEWPEELCSAGPEPHARLRPKIGPL